MQNLDINLAKMKKNTPRDEKLHGKLFLLRTSMEMVLHLQNFAIFSLLVGKKVEVSLRFFDIFKRNMVFIFLLGS